MGRTTCPFWGIDAGRGHFYALGAAEVRRGDVGALEPATAGYLKIKPFGGPGAGAGAGAVNYLAHQNVGGVVTVPLRSPGTGNALTVTNTSRMINGTRTGTGTYEVQFDRNLRYGSATATVYVSSYYASATTWFDSCRPDTVRMSVWDANGAAADQYLYIQVDR
jgi:hypothetical protein